MVVIKKKKINGTDCRVQKKIHTYVDLFFYNYAQGNSRRKIAFSTDGARTIGYP